MTSLSLLSVSVLLVLVSTGVAGAQINSASVEAGTKDSAALHQIVERAVTSATEKFPTLKTNQIAVTLINLTQPEKLERGSYRGNDKIYPASVIKLFYLSAIHRWMEDGKVQDTAELRRAMRDMIVESYNEATGLIVDVLTGTTSGPELSPEDLEKWYEKRNAVNRYFASLGYTNINVNRKPWCEGPYGREMQSVKTHPPNHRNWLTTDATARLLTEIALRQSVSAKRSEEMLELLKRDPFDTGPSANGQSRGYTGLALPTGSKLWSKAGWTSETRHDAAYVELPDGTRFVLVTFTVDHANDREIIPTVARKIIEELKQLR